MKTQGSRPRPLPPVPIFFSLFLFFFHFLFLLSFDFFFSSFLISFLFSVLGSQPAAGRLALLAAYPLYTATGGEEGWPGTKRVSVSACHLSLPLNLLFRLN